MRLDNQARPAGENRPALTRLLALAACLTAAPVLADPPTDQPRPDFKVHSGLFTNPMELRFGSRTDWAAILDFNDAPIQRDTIVIYEHEVVEDARSQGIAIMYTDADYWSRVRTRLQRTITDRLVLVPAAEYVCLDIEFPSPVWANRTGGPGIYGNSPHGNTQFDAWYTYMRQHRPNELHGLSTTEEEEVLRRTYEAAFREFFLGIIREARAVAPTMKFGFYGFPNRRYGEYMQQGPTQWTRYNDSLSWMFDASDVLFPALYNQVQAVPDGHPNRRSPYEWEVSFLSWTIRGNIQEFRRCAGPDKKVIAFTGVMYQEPLDHEIRNTFLEPMDLDLSIRLPQQAGLDGVILWQMMSNQGDFNGVQQYLTTQVNPMVRQMFSVPDPDSPGSGGDSGNVGSGSGGGDSGSGGGDPGSGYRPNIFGDGSAGGRPIHGPDPRPPSGGDSGRGGSGGDQGDDHPGTSPVIGRDDSGQEDPSAGDNQPPTSPNPETPTTPGPEPAGRDSKNPETPATVQDGLKLSGKSPVPPAVVASPQIRTPPPAPAKSPQSSPDAPVVASAAAAPSQPAAKDQTSKRSRVLATIRASRQSSTTRAANSLAKSSKEAKAKSGQLSRAALASAIKRNKSRAALLAERNRAQTLATQPSTTADARSTEGQ